MNNSQIIKRVGRWAKKQFPEIIIGYERVYKISADLAGISKPYMRIDVVAKNKSGREIFGVECKTINDHKTFREIATAIGQAYVLKRMFGRAYIALEVNKSFLEKYKTVRYSWLTNINDELGIGVIFVNRNVVLIEEAKYEEPGATTLFVPLASKYDYPSKTKTRIY